MTKSWLPLESNPDVMNDYVSKMGLDVSKIQFHDVMSTEDWALEMIPRPVLGTYVHPLNPMHVLIEQFCNSLSLFNSDTPLNTVIIINSIFIIIYIIIIMHDLF